MPKLRALSCVGFHYSTNGFGDLQTNFTFQFPPQTGHVFHIPTFSIVDTANPAMWETKLADSKGFYTIHISDSKAALETGANRT